MVTSYWLFFFSRRRRHTSCALVTGVQTCALPIYVRAFPEDARTDAGWQLELVQRGDDPDDWKPMKTVGQGVQEIRIREASGAFRVIYLATLEDRVLEIGGAL